MTIQQKISALVPRSEDGQQFVVYGDSCSGIAGGPFEATFAQVNAVVQRLQPAPEFICFLGDEIKGLLADDAALRGQWKYWLDEEMRWLDRTATPLYHCTANHTAYDPASEAIFCEVLPHLPRNGPPNQRGLSYFVRRGDLLLVLVNTMWSGLGGEGYVETEWLDATLAAHADARHKLVLGHHPVFAVNGFSGEHQRTVALENGRVFWDVLVRHGVLAYWCSHIMAFDVQVHDGVLQILTGGAGTQPLTPATEYHHCVQAAVDALGLRYQVLDRQGQVREWLTWPLPALGAWRRLAAGEQAAPVLNGDVPLLIWRVSGVAADSADGTPQTILSGYDDSGQFDAFWIGLVGVEQRMTLQLSPEPGRSPRHWLGSTLAAGEPFSLQIAMHFGMGPGGMMWRWGEDASWQSFDNAVAWGAEHVAWMPTWSVGHDQRGETGRPFRGGNLAVEFQQMRLSLAKNPLD